LSHCKAERHSVTLSHSHTRCIALDGAHLPRVLHNTAVATVLDDL
jgi:hypothetical protein